MLRLSAPTERETYDADLRRFQATARKQFAAWVASLNAHQHRTDILGALDAARQALALLPKGTDRRLIVVTDFLEDDGAYRFASDSSLTNSERARELAERLRKQHGFTLQGVPLCLGRLESGVLTDCPRNAKRRSRRSGRRILLQRMNQPTFNSTARGCSPIPRTRALRGNDSPSTTQRSMTT